ncbi:hypothetical protein Xmau_02197 [Xenorhabdus mauleonii]|uniref:DUF4123 domain-containing protein n=1 Tax=Xenorhabdus mauleonii TaxID=351675 RepID=A0A1I3QC48_9GAMM|nr:DUF4123 domain-containing protein [Xenorhabdus mauleonii]PHM40013.1 hypothetical protein Xmau_02197 [Xenorhabdus mauleonii]SFJ31478.1 protein of unknown function [Xenorhabdus mauleonii]
MSWLPDCSEYWVVDYSFSKKEGEQFSAQAIIHAKSERQALSMLVEYLLDGGYSPGQYHAIQPLLDYLTTSSRQELPLLRHFRQGQEQGKQVIALNERNISSPLPVERGALQFTVTEKMPENGAAKYRYAVLDAAVYRQVMGSFLISDLMVSNLQWESLFQGETQVTLEDSAPYLVELTESENVYSRFQQTITQPATSSLGIFIESDQPFTVLRNHLRKFTYLKNEQQQTWMFYRFYVPQGLIPLLKSLPDAQLLHFMQPMQKVGYFDQQTALYYSLSLVEDALDKNRTAPVTINPVLTNSLAEQTQQRALTQMVKFIEETQPELSPQQKAQLPAFVLQQSNLACLAGFAHQRSILYLVAARSLVRDDEARWQRAWEYACRESQAQELRALACYEYCFKNRALS